MAYQFSVVNPSLILVNQATFHVTNAYTQCTRKHGHQEACRFGYVSALKCFYTAELKLDLAWSYRVTVFVSHRIFCLRDKKQPPPTNREIRVQLNALRGRQAGCTCLAVPADWSCA